MADSGGNGSPVDKRAILHNVLADGRQYLRAGLGYSKGGGGRAKDDVIALIKEYNKNGEPAAALKLQKLIPALSPDEKDEVLRWIGRSNGQDQIKNRPSETNKRGGGMSDDDQIAAVPSGGGAATTAGAGGSSLLAAEIEEKIKTIDERLAQIAAYRFIPPSIKEEKSGLEEKRKVLIASKEKISAGRPAPADAPSAETLVEAPAAVPGPSLPPIAAEESSLIFETPKNDWDIDQPQKAEDRREPAAAAPLVGDGYAFRQEEKEDKKEEIEEEDKDSDLEEAADQDWKEDFKPKNLGADPAGQAKEIVELFKKTLKTASSPDEKYLEKVAADFDAKVRHLADRAEKAKMDEEKKAKAVKGRLALYLEEIKTEFEFSELLSAELKDKIAEALK